MKLDVKKSTGAKAGTVDVPDELFGIEPNTAVMHQVVTAQLAAKRSGTHSTKTRAEVRGGGAKPWRQKGTGRARQGTIRAPQFTGGGHAFAKQPRTYDQKVNRKAAKAALRSALASHAGAGTLAIVAASSFEEPSTKAARGLVEGAGLATPLVVVAQPDEQALIRSFRNLERVAIVSPGELEVAAVVWARSLLVTENALPTLTARAG